MTESEFTAADVVNERDLLLVIGAGEGAGGAVKNEFTETGDYRVVATRTRAADDILEFKADLSSAEAVGGSVVRLLALLIEEDLSPQILLNTLAAKGGNLSAQMEHSATHDNPKYASDVKRGHALMHEVTHRAVRLLSPEVESFAVGYKPELPNSSTSAAALYPPAAGKRALEGVALGESLVRGGISSRLDDGMAKRLSLR